MARRLNVDAEESTRPSQPDARGRSPKSLGQPFSRLRTKPRGFYIVLASLGPGLIAANAGNDAGGIATYATAGATYGYNLLWIFVLILVSVSVVQEMAARMGAATGKGLADLIRENFSIHATAFVLLALLISNAGTVVSEFVGISASLQLILPPGFQYIAVPVIAAILWLTVVKGSYSSVERVFLVMTLVFLAYPISAVLAHPDWGRVAHATFIPSFHTNQGYLFMLVALVGTTITPYMQVYVQSAVADKGISVKDYLPERIEVYLGTAFAVLVAAFIVIATAATLYPQHIPVQSAADAARALGPIAGKYAELLFATGLFGASVLAAAILPLATAYSITEALGVEKGLNLSFREAPVFMGLFTGLIVLGVLIALIPGLPLVRVLLLVQVISGLLLPVVLFAIMRLINSRKLMGNMTNGPIYNTIAWGTTIVVSLLSIAFIAVTVLGLFGVQFS